MSSSVEIHDERFRPLVLGNAKLEVLAAGFRWLEGPVWFADQECLIFSDLPNDRVLRWCEHGVTPFRQGGFANGHARDRAGRLIECSHRDRCVRRLEYDGSLTVLASHFAGARLNSPNDVVVKSDGSVWFSDPIYGISTDYEGGKQIAELPAAVYRIDPDGGIDRVADDFIGPNGLCFSPDESLLYISDTGDQFAATPEGSIGVFPVLGDRLGGGREFYSVSPGLADGFRADEGGRLWSSAGDGVHCIHPDGTLLGKILLGSTVSNVAFGGRHLSRLFICAGDTLQAIYLNTRGVALS